MAYATAQNVLDLHKYIPATESTYIVTLISDADIEIDLRLGIVGYTVPFTAPIPDVINVISKYKAVYKELKRLYGSQVEEAFYDWVKAWDDEAEKLLKLLEGGALLEDVALPKAIESSTEDFTPIFDLGDVEAWAYQPDDDDLRYGEDS